MPVTEPPPLYVGPVYVGESQTQVIRTLGTPTYGLGECEDNGPGLGRSCERMLKYTDGKSVLIVEVVPDEGELCNIIRIRAGRPDTAVNRLNPKYGTLASWRWEGHRIFDLPLPRKVPNWTVVGLGTDAVEYDRGHGTGVVFSLSKNKITEVTLGEE